MEGQTKLSLPSHVSVPCENYATAGSTRSVVLFDPRNRGTRSEGTSRQCRLVRLTCGLTVSQPRTRVLVRRSQKNSLSCRVSRGRLGSEAGRAELGAAGDSDHRSTLGHAGSAPEQASWVCQAGTRVRSCYVREIRSDSDPAVSDGYRSRRTRSDCIDQRVINISDQVFDGLDTN
jgi:hypothetical protein